MIRLFESGRRILFFQRSWANAVTRWILGVHSPEGTIKINNTADPGKDRSVALDVDVAAVASRIGNIIREHGFSASQRSAVKEIIRDVLDGISLTWNSGGTFSVNREWIESVVKTIMQDGAQMEAPSGTSTLDSGYSGVVANPTVMSDTFTAGAAGGMGLKVKLCTRTEDYGEHGKLAFREFTITPDGRIYAVAGESDAMGVYTDN